MSHSVGLDVSQKSTAICVVDANGKRICRGICPTDPVQISQSVFKHAGADAKVGVETGPDAAVTYFDCEENHDPEGKDIHRIIYSE